MLREVLSRVLHPASSAGLALKVNALARGQSPCSKASFRWASEASLFLFIFQWKASLRWSALRGGLGAGLACTSLDFWCAESNALLSIFFGTSYNFPIPLKSGGVAGVKIESVE